MNSLLIIRLPGGMMGSLMLDLSRTYYKQVEKNNQPATQDELMISFDEVTAYHGGYPPSTPFSQYVKNLALMNDAA